mgnify:CR=1 FL=1
MNVIDQAFVKAFARRSQPPVAPSTVAAGRSPQLIGRPVADVSVHPQAAQSAVMWYDTAAEDYLRQDPGHRQAAPLGDTQVRTAPQLPQQQTLPLRAATQPSVEPAAPPTDPTGNIDLSVLFHSTVACAEPTDLPREATPVDQSENSVVCQESTAPPPHVSAATEPAEEPFAAGWEVDRFEFSKTVMALFSDPALVQSIGHPLDRAVNEGLQTLLITGDRTGVGQTSVATGIAISAAAAGLRVALVDATTAAGGQRTGTLADALNLEVQQGWPETLRAGQPAAQAAVYSIEDQLTVVPQTAPRRSAEPTAEEFRRLIASLRDAFDLVVIDGPCCREHAFKSFTATAQPISQLPHTPRPADSTVQPPVDAVILVQDIRQADQVLAKQVMQSLRFHGITGLGLVENFT